MEVDNDARNGIDWIAKSETLTVEIQDFINGDWYPNTTAPSFTKFSPRDGRLLYGVGQGKLKEADSAISAANAAIADGRWSKKSAQQRAEILLRLASLVEDSTEELALCESIDVGKPIYDALSIDVPKAAATFRAYAALVGHAGGCVYADDQTNLSYMSFAPIGVVAAIVGWNFPLLLAAEKIAPALAAGNSIILKPSELSCLSAARIAELALKAGVPCGVFNVVHGTGEVGSYLSHHRDVDMVSFTGSSPVGKKLLVASGESNMKRLLLECGGKAPNIIFDDAPNLTAVADAVVARAFWNQGQVCTASSRLLVQKNIKEELLGYIVQKVGAITIGDPLKADTKFGAVISDRHKKKVLNYIDIGEHEGARLAYRGPICNPCNGGSYVAPAIFDSVLPHHRIAQEEIFGPVLSIMTFEDEAEAVKLANSTTYGLSAIVWTRDVGRGHRMSREIKAGWIVINGTERPSGGPGTGILSIGGHKQSGFGVEGGIEGLKAYMHKTSVQYFV
jgi:acyl-CoA reductase-like NAD-dependent aldehyde dehydrogenase